MASHAQSLWVYKISGDSTDIITPTATLLLTNACLSLEQPDNVFGRGVLELGQQNNAQRIAISSFIRSVCEQDLLDVKLKAGVSYTLASLGPFSIDVVGYYTADEAPEKPSASAVEKSQPPRSEEHGSSSAPDAATDPSTPQGTPDASVVRGTVTGRAEDGVATIKVAGPVEPSVKRSAVVEGGATLKEASSGARAVRAVAVVAVVDAQSSGSNADLLVSGDEGTERGVKSDNGGKGAAAESLAVGKTAMSDSAKVAEVAAAHNASVRRSSRSTSRATEQKASTASASNILPAEAVVEVEVRQPFTDANAPARAPKEAAKAKAKKSVPLERPTRYFTPRNLFLLDIIARNGGQAPSKHDFQIAWSQLQNNGTELKAYKDLASARKEQGILQGMEDPADLAKVKV